jgi:hypothetical protein
MRLTADEITHLPYCCALVDRTGSVASSTPEWRGFSLGALTYEAGIGKLVIIPDGCKPEVDGLVVELVAEVMAAGRTLSTADRRSVEMLAAGLALVGGRLSGATNIGNASDAIAYAIEGARRSAPAVTVRVESELDLPVAAPAALGLGLLQLIRNAHRHAGAVDITVRVTRGPTLSVEWADESTGTSVSTARRADQRKRWGLGFARLLADSMGGVLTAPVSLRPGVLSSAIGLGASRLAAPLACSSGGTIERASRAWDEETRLPPGSRLDQQLELVASNALARPGEVAYSGIYRARSVGSRVWLGVAPQSSLGRARDVLRGIQHENALLSAAQPHATRIFALASILARVVSDEGFEAVSPGVWQRDFAPACAAMGLHPAPGLSDGRLTYPEPRVTAFLLAAVGGNLKELDDPGTGSDHSQVCIEPERRDHPLVRLLSNGSSRIHLGA